MQTLLLAILATLGIALMVVLHNLRGHRRFQQLERDALSMTPTGDTNLTGHWHARQETDTGYVSCGIQLEQHGMAVTGWMQCKFAAAHPLTIRGILDDGNLIATWSRPHKDYMGSGIIHLTVSSDGNTLAGTTKWYNADNQDGHVDNWCWERTQSNTSAETQQNNAVNRSGEVGRI